MGPRLGTRDPQEGCQLLGPFSPPAEESYLSTTSESHVEAKKSPTNHHISSPGSLLHCLYQTGKSNISSQWYQRRTYLPPIFDSLPSSKNGSHPCPETLPSNLTYENTLLSAAQDINDPPEPEGPWLPRRMVIIWKAKRWRLVSTAYNQFKIS